METPLPPIRDPSHLFFHCLVEFFTGAANKLPPCFFMAGKTCHLWPEHKRLQEQRASARGNSRRRRRRRLGFKEKDEAEAGGRANEGGELTHM